jgi:hypothetical protein
MIKDHLFYTQIPEEDPLKIFVKPWSIPKQTDKVRKFTSYIIRSLL